MPTVKDYQLEFRRFISSQHLYTGIRVTACVIIPAWILYHYGLLSTMTSIPLGALFVGLTDNPGPVQHRRNGMLIGACLNSLVVLIAGLSRFSPLLIGIEIVFFGILFSLIAVYGIRASSIGLTALIIFILSTNQQFPSVNLLQTSFYYLLGALWYIIISLSLNTLRPYRPVQQLLGECLMKTSSYLLTKGLFYNRKEDSSAIFARLMEQQVSIHQYQEQLRSMLFNTRRFLLESTTKGRILTIMFRDSIDLFERAITTHHEYQLLHREFDGSGILETFHSSINSMASILYNIGLAVQEGTVYRDEKALQYALEESTNAFARLRKEKLAPANVESFIKLRHILNSLQNLADRIKRLQVYTTYDSKLSSDFKSDVDLSKFTTHQEINVNLIISNLSLKSSAFRHALRLTLALMIGYCISLIFSLGHGYWILLTIATIIKPAYSLSKKRNIQRLLGTFAGAVAAFLVLYFSASNAVIFVIMIVMMVMAYSLLRINYALSIAGITVYLLFSFHFLYPQGLDRLLTDRIIDTIIASMIAYLVSYFILPAWEHQQIDRLMTTSAHAVRRYFITVANAFTGNAPATTAYKFARKEAFVSLANLSDTFQRMLSDPKDQQPNLPLYHQFVSADHLLASYIASLSDYAQRYGTVYQHGDFQPLINMIDKTFAGIDENESTVSNFTGEELNATPVLKRVQRLIDQRKKELENKELDNAPAETRKTLNELVRITDQFRLIHATAAEAVKIKHEIESKKFPRPFRVENI